jgi:glycerol-3-phosphate acyltransferase PlsX
MRLVVDVMGESPIEKTIDGIRKFASIHKDLKLILVGKTALIKKVLKTENEFEIVDAKEVVSPTTPLTSTLRNRNTSMYIGMMMVQNNQADGMLTAGYTAAYVALSHLIIKPIPGINKPAFMSYVPTANGRGFIFLDVGANITCSGHDLYQFALMANIYCQSIRKIKSPIIKVLNIGTEENKGFDFQKEANILLKQNNKINYQGFIESRELTLGEADIVVCDGYTGNVALKALEGCMLGINGLLKKEYKKPKN